MRGPACSALTDDPARPYTSSTVPGSKPGAGRPTSQSALPSRFTSPTPSTAAPALLPEEPTTCVPVSGAVTEMLVAAGSGFGGLVVWESQASGATPATRASGQAHSARRASATAGAASAR